MFWKILKQVNFYGMLDFYFENLCFYVIVLEGLNRYDADGCLGGQLPRVQKSQTFLLQ